MKIRLGNKTIPLSEVEGIHRAGKRVTVIRFKNGESIKVVCGVSIPESSIPYFTGTCDELESLIERLK